MTDVTARGDPCTRAAHIGAANPAPHANSAISFKEVAGQRHTLGWGYGSAPPPDMNPQTGVDLVMAGPSYLRRVAARNRRQTYAFHPAHHVAKTQPTPNALVCR